MQQGIGSQLIIAVATLAGVLLTLLTNAFLERRRAHDARALESLRLASEHAKWLREERQHAYAVLSITGEEVLQFFRSELLSVAEQSDPRRRAEGGARWRELRTELRKAYNQVALFGGDEAREAALHVWRTARNGGNDFFDLLDAGGTSSASERIKATASQLGTAGGRFLDACRKDLQG